MSAQAPRVGEIIDSRLNKLKQSLESATNDVSSDQWNRHPPGKWCAEQILEHLYLSYTGTTKGFERVMVSGKPLATRPSMAHRVRTLVVVRFGHMPAGVKAPEMAVPKGLPVETVQSEFGNKLAEMDAIITSCEARFGGRVHVLDHPILGPLTAPQWRKMHVVHGRHHCKQLLQLRDGAKKEMR